MTSLSIKNREEERMIRENLEIVQKEIADACRRAGRDRDEVTLIAVSKTKPISIIREAYEAGIRDFGENRVQEMVEKMQELPSDIRWHMIGHLQKNKVKYLVGRTALIHSVDSLALAEEISREAVKRNVCADILIEVNVAEEESKFGVSVREAASLVDGIAVLPGIRVRGLMTVAPPVGQAEENRTYFRELAHLAVDIGHRNIDNVNMCLLSMGMTGDYPVAIEEGASYVRVGTGIFGGRNAVPAGDPADRSTAGQTADSER